MVSCRAEIACVAFLLLPVWAGGDVGGSPPAAVACADEPCAISLFRLYGHPETYEGKLVKVVGYSLVSLPDTLMLYPMPAVPFAFPGVDLGRPLDGASAARFDNRAVVVTGRFSQKCSGVCMGVGVMREIIRLEEWPSPWAPR